jgi:hypothetical protein
MSESMQLVRRLDKSRQMLRSVCAANDIEDYITSAVTRKYQCTADGNRVKTLNTVPPVGDFENTIAPALSPVGIDHVVKNDNIAMALWSIQRRLCTTSRCSRFSGGTAGKTTPIGFETGWKS